MSTDKTVSIGFEEFGDPTPGLWCPRCNLPSGATVPLMVTVNGQPDHLAEIRACVDCGEVLRREP